MRSHTILDRSGRLADVEPRRRRHASGVRPALRPAVSRRTHSRGHRAQATAARLLSQQQGAMYEKRLGPALKLHPVKVNLQCQQVARQLAILGDPRASKISGFVVLGVGIRILRKPNPRDPLAKRARPASACQTPRFPLPSKALVSAAPTLPIVLVPSHASGLPISNSKWV